VPVDIACFGRKLSPPFDEDATLITGFPPPSVNQDT
jgi:hypothetical protein